MAYEEPRVIQPLVIMAPPPDPRDTFDESEPDRFVEDTSVVDGLTFEQWCAQRRPLPVVADDPDSPYAGDVPEI